MQKVSWIQWFVRMIWKDMEQYEEDVGTKEEVYRIVKYKSECNKNKGGRKL